MNSLQGPAIFLAQFVREAMAHDGAAMCAFYAWFEQALGNVVDNALRDFRLGGAELQGAAKARFAEIQQALAEASQQFAEHVIGTAGEPHGRPQRLAVDEIAGDRKSVV